MSVEAVEWKALPSRPCPVAGALDLFGDRWSILIIRDVMNGVRRFDDLVTRLGVSRATLADRLRRLVDAGILVPSPYQPDRGRSRDEYRLTDKGWELRNVLIALREWGDRHALDDGEERLRLVDRDTGHEVGLRLVDVATGDDASGRRLVHVLAPGKRTTRVRRR
jgi:DNA-binding HxlR family transcriptional regulator